MLKFLHPELRFASSESLDKEIDVTLRCLKSNEFFVLTNY